MMRPNKRMMNELFAERLRRVRALNTVGAPRRVRLGCGGLRYWPNTDLSELSLIDAPPEEGAFAWNLRIGL